MTDPFDFDHFVALPRLFGLRLSPDGSRLIVAVDTPAPDGKKLRTALWQVDPGGSTAPRRLTRSAAGEMNAAFLPDGALVFTSARPDPDAKPGDDDEPPAGLWWLGSDGGEARLLVAPPGGISRVKAAVTSGTLALLAPLHAGATDFASDGELETARKDAGVSALLFESYPIRWWDHYLGPREARLFVAEAPTMLRRQVVTTDDPSGAMSKWASGSAAPVGPVRSSGGASGSSSSGASATNSRASRGPR